MKNILKKIKARFRRIWTIFCGRTALKKIVRQYSGNIIVLTDRGIGDQVFMLAYLKKWASYYQVENWRVLAINTNDAVYKSFDIDESRLIKIPAKRDEQINIFCTCIYGKRFRHHHPEVLAANAFGYFLGRHLLVNPCIFDFSSLTKAVYRIPQDTEPSECVGCEVEDLLRKLGEQGITELKKCIVINPYAFSCDQTPIGFFQKTADALAKEGFSVLCSAVGEQKHLDGTVRVDMRLDEMFTLCNICGMLIGARSGFMDMMAFTDADIICISNINYEYADLFKLEKCWPQNPKIRTVDFNASDEDGLVTRIVDHFCGVYEKMRQD